MEKLMKACLCTAILALWWTVPGKAADVVVHGVVTDAGGKPVRGAMVRAAANGKSVIRYSQKDGSYQIPVATGTYDVSVDAFGYLGKRESTNAGAATTDVNFSLTPKIDVNRLVGADVERLIPDDTQGRLIKGTCIDCHDLAYVMHKRGYTADEWASFLPEMTRGRRTQPVYSPKKLAALSAALEKYFGPNSQYFGPDADPPTREQLHHPDVADVVLKATIREYTPPAGLESFVHSVTLTDGLYGRPSNFTIDPHVESMVWFTQAGIKWGAAGSSKVASFNPVTEEFKEYETNVHQDHTGVIDAQGRYWIAAANPGLGKAKLAMVDTKTGEVKSFVFPGKMQGAHTAVLDQAGNVWFSTNGSEPATTEVWTFDTKKEQFKSYKIPMPAQYAAGSYADWRQQADDVSEDAPSAGNTRYGTYHVSIDSKGMVWASSLTMGMIAKIDPSTGEVTKYIPPDVPGIRGILVDQHDNIWFSDYFHHHLGKLDPKTGKFKMYQPPTLGATPYGIVEERRTGYIWYADQTGSNITRFDPKTEQFAEYPITRPGYPRFLDVDRKGQVWFGEYFSGKIAVLNPGQNTESASR